MAIIVIAFVAGAIVFFTAVVRIACLFNDSSPYL
jgi:hypothetical protein